MIFAIHFVTHTQTVAQDALGGSILDSTHARLININNLAMWIHSDGLSAANPFTLPSPGWQRPQHLRDLWKLGIMYPRGVTVGLSLADGIVWGGRVHDGAQPIIRVGGSTWSSGLQAGAILEPGVSEPPNDPLVNRVWRYRGDWQTADLLDEARDIMISSTPSGSTGFPVRRLQPLADALRAAYEYDLLHWPWHRGAPFYDDNHNGVMDDNELPGLLDADQVVWTVTNDLESTASLYGSPAIGIEMQTTLWAYKWKEHLENAIFKRHRLIYKGTRSTPSGAAIDSMFIAQWADTDIGSFQDDLFGCDTTVNLAYCYNAPPSDAAYDELGLRTPAAGYILLKGPVVVDSTMPEALNLKQRHHAGFLEMTNCVVFHELTNPPFPHGWYGGTMEWWRSFRGFYTKLPSPITNWLTGETTKYMYTGSPISNSGWVTTLPGDRVYYSASGPFTMALGDTQEVIIAFLAGMAEDPISSFKLMRYRADLTRQFLYSGFNPASFADKEAARPEFFELKQNFPNPFNGSTEIRYDLPGEMNVSLTIYNWWARR